VAKIEGYYFEDLSVGMSGSFAKTLSEADVSLLGLKVVSEATSTDWKKVKLIHLEKAPPLMRRSCLTQESWNA
jgi:hypothetical protein